MCIVLLIVLFDKIAKFFVRIIRLSGRRCKNITAFLREGRVGIVTRVAFDILNEEWRVVSTCFKILHDCLSFFTPIRNIPVTFCFRKITYTRKS